MAAAACSGAAGRAGGRRRDLAQQRVGEDVGVAFDPDHQPLQGRSQRPLDLRGRLLRHGAQGVEGRLPPEHGGDVEHLPGVLRERRQPRGHQAPQRLGHLVLLREHPGQRLLGEQRVAVGPAVHQPHLLGGRRPAEQGAEVLAGLLAVEPGERQHGDLVEPHQLGVPVAQVRIHLRLVGAQRQHHAAPAPRAGCAPGSSAGRAWTGPPSAGPPGPPAPVARPPCRGGWTRSRSSVLRTFSSSRPWLDRLAGTPPSGRAGGAPRSIGASSCGQHQVRRDRSRSSSVASEIPERLDHRGVRHGLAGHREAGARSAPALPTRPRTRPRAATCRCRPRRTPPPCRESRRRRAPAGRRECPARPPGRRAVLLR